MIPDLTHAELARSSFLYYLSYVEGLHPYRHIKEIAQVLTGPERLSIIVVPPGHGKSTLVSQTFPSWYLGNHPDRSILQISNTDKQAKLFLGANQQTMEYSEKWAEVFPDAAPDPDRGWSSDGLFLKWKRDPNTGLALPGWRSKSAADKDPALSSFGVGGPVIGRRADIILVDDPYSQDMARSELQRQVFLDWFRQTLLSRLKPDAHAKVVVALTRWHPEDVVRWAELQNEAEQAVTLSGPLADVSR